MDKRLLFLNELAIQQLNVFKLALAEIVKSEVEELKPSC